jgi:hypothetical protein
MQRPYETAIVDALIAASLRKAVGSSHTDDLDEAANAESLALRILCDPEDAILAGHDGSVHAIAGFRIALRLCCRVLADPLHVHAAGVRRDVREARSLVQEWRNDRKTPRESIAEPDISMLVLRALPA